ncbi:MAG TPA: TadE family type IV pilus minor pilin [Mycobacteriales bacterium]|jgi:Flp pilus assembly protein TadG|nr:TadE family type IV pilus minor pilin [Mycobacteriales bacterium]
MTTRTQRGSATAELAVALPALLAVLALCVWALSVVAATLRCADAARAAARAAARGEAPETVAATARRTAGRPVATARTADGDLVTVRVTARLAPPLLGRLLPPVTVAQAATAHGEPPGEEP